MNNAPNAKFLKGLQSLLKSKTISLGMYGLAVLISHSFDGIKTGYPQLRSVTGKSLTTLKLFLSGLESAGVLQKHVSNNYFVLVVNKSGAFQGSRNLPATEVSSISMYYIQNKETIDSILEHLSQLSMRKKPFKATDDTVSLIKSRIADGYTLDDFKRVHENMRWWTVSAKMEEYYRPSTLYRKTNFPKYLEVERRFSNDEEKKYTDLHTTTNWRGKELSDRQKRLREKLKNTEV